MTDFAGVDIAKRKERDRARPEKKKMEKGKTGGRRGLGAKYKC